MEDKILSPEEGFELITEVINEARNRFEENGFIYMFWGLLLAVTSLGQFLLLKYGFPEESWYPYLLMPLGAVYTSFYYSKKRGTVKKNKLWMVLSYAWIVISLNLMILGFAFSTFLRENTVPVILIILSLGIVISGVAIKSKMMLYSGIFINLSGFVCFPINWMYHPLVTFIISLTAIFIPGMILMLKFKKRMSDV